MKTIAVLNGTSRTGRILVERALENGYQVKAIVRSARRFSTHISGHKNLVVEEFSDFKDITTLQRILLNTDVLVLIAGLPIDEPNFLVQDVVQSSVAAIRANLWSTTAVKTRVVLMSAANISPAMDRAKDPHPFPTSLIEKFGRDYVLKYTYQDLRRAQEYLFKQTSWLDFVVVAPGPIADVPDKDAELKQWRLSTTELPLQGPISYLRLASLMLSIAEEGKEFNHEVVLPIPTTPVANSLKDIESVKTLVLHWFKVNVFIPGFRGLTIFAVGIAVGRWWRSWAT